MFGNDIKNTKHVLNVKDNVTARYIAMFDGIHNRYSNNKDLASNPNALNTRNNEMLKAFVCLQCTINNLEAIYKKSQNGGRKYIKNKKKLSLKYNKKKYHRKTKKLLL